MKYVIDIDEDYIKIINKNGGSNYTENVIQNATPLEKVLENIKVEFREEYPNNCIGEPELDGNTCYFSLNDIIKVLDKHISGK